MAQVDEIDRIISSVERDDATVPVLINTKRFADQRGWFQESYSEQRYAELGITCQFVQDNESMSTQRGTIRGLHFQTPPMAQAKLVRVMKGSVLDVAVDIRAGSPTYGRFLAVELSAANAKQFYIPEGFAHGFYTLEDETIVSYKVSRFYSPQHDGGIRWDDPQIGIPWPESKAVVVSDKDSRQPLLKEWQSKFAYTGEPLAPSLVEE